MPVSNRTASAVSTARTIHGGDGGVEPDVEAALGQLGEPGGEGLVLGGEQPWPALHDGDFGAEGAEDVPELRGDVAAPDHDQRGRHLGDAHDGVRRVEFHLVQARDRWDDRARPGGHHNPVRAQVLVADLQDVRTHKPGRVGIDVDPVLTSISNGAVMEGVDAVEDAGPDGEPVDPVEGGVHPESVPLADGVRGVGGDHQHLGRDAAAIQTRAAEAVLLDDRCAEVRQLAAEEHVAAARSDHDQVVVLRVVGCGPITPRDGGWVLPGTAIGLGFAVSSYQVSPNGSLAVSSGSIPNQQTDTCWIVITNNGRYPYTPNFGSGTISSYAADTAVDGADALLAQQLTVDAPNAPSPARRWHAGRRVLPRRVLPRGATTERSRGRYVRVVRQSNRA